MGHLTQLEIEEAAEGHTPRAVRDHLASCTVCGHRLEREARLVNALHTLPRLDPAPDLMSRINAAVGASPAKVVFTPRMVAVGIAAGLAIVFVLGFVYQTIVALQTGGALDFISVYSSQPEILTMYPSEALSALVEALPLAEILMTLGVLVVAIVLMQQFFSALALVTSSDPNRRGAARWS